MIARRQDFPPPASVHRCLRTRELALAGMLALLGFGWLFQTVHASEVERAVLKDRLARMSEDVAAIRGALEEALKRERELSSLPDKPHRSDRSQPAPGGSQP